MFEHKPFFYFLTFLFLWFPFFVITLVNDYDYRKELLKWNT